MASLFEKPGSPFWWIKFRDPKTGIIQRQSTGRKVGIGADTRKAREMQAEKTLAERKLAAGNTSEKWENWVVKFLNEHFGKDSASLKRYLTAWRTIVMFLNEKEITSPRQLTREHCLNYVSWRQEPDYRNGKYRAGRNTAIFELKVLGQIMKEAVNRGMAIANPCRELDLKKDPRKLRPEYSDDELDKIEKAICNVDEPLKTFFQNSFLIARWHGVRLKETYLNPMEQVWKQDVKGECRWMILFHQKGGKSMPKILHPKLIPLFESLIANKKTETYQRPKNPAREWHNFLKRIGIKDGNSNACFHSLRITVASRLARAGITERKAMEYLTHASTTVHQAYIRWKPEDLDDCHHALLPFPFSFGTYTSVILKPRFSRMNRATSDLTTRRACRGNPILRLMALIIVRPIPSSFRHWTAEIGCSDLAIKKS